jgi:hypothetical protein
MNAAGRPSKIHLIGEGRYEEGIAAGTIKPGHLIKITAGGSGPTSDSGLDRRVVKNTGGAGDACEALFAVEDALQGRTIDDNYVLGERVFYVIAGKGDVIQAWLSGGEHAQVGDELIHNGDGTFQVAAGSDASQTRMAVALEEIDRSHSSGTDDRIKVRIL